MPLVPAPIPPPPPPPVRTDARLEIEPDEQWKADLRRRIEHNLRGMVENAQTLYDTILNSQPSESSRESATVQYDKSMGEIRTLAQEAFTRQLRAEMAERKWALDVVDSNSPDVARQQQWILDNIHKAEEQRLPFVPEDGTHRPASGHSSSPRQQGDGERVSDGGFENRFEDGFGSTRSEGEGGASDGLAESEEEEEEEEDDDDDEENDDDDDDDEDEVHEVDGSEPRQSRSPSRPSALVHPLQSKSPVSRRGPPSRQRHPSNNPPPEYHDEEEVDDPHGQPPRRQGSQPYVSSGTPARRPSLGSQGAYRRHPPPPRTTEPSGISRTLAHANGQTYSTSPIQFKRRSSVNSTGSASSSAGLHRASSLNIMNTEQYRSGNIAPHTPGGTDRPQAHNRDRIVNVPPRERQTSALASPHDKPSPPSYPIAPRPIPGQRPPSLDDAIRFPTSASPSSRAIYGPQRSPEDVRQGIAIPRGPTTPDEGPRGASWGSSLQSRRSFGDFGAHRRHNSKGDSRLPPVDGDYSDASDDVVGQLDDRHSVYSAHSIRSMRSMELEQLAIRREAEARRKEDEATRKEEEATRKEEEAHRLEEKARQSLEEAERLEKGARQAEASAKLREAAAQKKEAEAKLKEAEAKKREAEVQKREAQAQHKEEEARLREVAARRKEEQARRKEEEVVRKEEDARKREEEVRRIEDEARKREDDARRREDDARKRERMARKMEEDARRFEDEARKMEEEVRRKEEEARRRKEEARRVEEDFERKRREIEQKEAELKKREDELSILEDAARRAQEEVARQAEETARIQAEAETARLQAEEVARQVGEAARLQAEEAIRLQSEEAARQAEETSGLDRVTDESARQTLEPEDAAPRQEKQMKGQGKKAKGQSKRQKEKALEEQRQNELEQQRLEEKRLEEEERLRQAREKQIRLDEELSRQEQERLAHEAILEQERHHFEAQEREANRLREEQLRASEEEQHRHLEEQRRKIAEQGRHRDEQLRNEQFRQQQQRIKEEQQKEFERREAQYYQRTVERERQNSMGATFDSWPPHRPNSTTGSAGDRSSASSTFNGPASSTWSSHSPSMGSTHTTSSSFTSSSSIPFSSTPKPSPPNTKPGAPGTSPYAAKFDEAEWARRAEERARQQQEQFKREQERLESERQAKTSKMLSREELIRLYENHDNKWRQLKDSDNLGWNSFAWPVFRRPSEPEEMTTSAIGAYVLSKYAPDANTKSSKDRVKDHIKRWHPDKFETRILPRVAEEEREKVKAGAGVVVRGLNELLNRNYDD